MISTINRVYKKGMFRIVPIAIILAVLSISCRVSWVAEYSASIAQQIEVVAKKIDKFYLIIEETTTEENQREYSAFTEQYIDIEVELKNLLAKNKKRAKNKESITINETVLKKWMEYKEIHKKQNDLKNSAIKLNLINLQNLMNSFRVAEEAKRGIK
jgi:hypothetical protein